MEVEAKVVCAERTHDERFGSRFHAPREDAVRDAPRHAPQSKPELQKTNDPQQS
jgi:hypothetical protein